LPVGNNSQLLVELDAAGGLSELRTLTVINGPIADPQLARAATGEVLVAAEFSGTVVTMNAPTVTTPSGVSGIYVATFPATGAATNLTHIEGGGAVRLMDIAVDGSGRPRLALEAEAGLAIGGSDGEQGGYLVELDTTGAPQVAQWLGVGVSAATGVAFDGAATFLAGATDGPAEPLGIAVSFEAAPDAFLVAADVPWGAGFVSAAALTPGKVAVTGSAAFAVGEIAGATNFGGKVRTLVGVPAGGYVVGYNRAGSNHWVRVLRATAAVDVLGVTATIDGVYAVGSFEGELQIGANAEPSKGGKDIFVVHYSNVGGQRWYRTFGGGGDDIAHAVAAHSGGAITVVGEFAGTVDFGTGAPTTAANGANAFALRLAPAP
jgi:hypothetical protein